MKYESLVEYIKAEEASYQTPITVSENYDWNMKEHLETIVCYINTKLYETANDPNKPLKNIILPIINLQHRATGFDLKDILLYVDDSEKYYMSFLVKKYYEIWARKQHMDDFIDDLVETYVDFGGVLVKNIKGAKPEVVPWATIAFCDQTDILSGPFAIRHYYSPEQLKEKAKAGWENIDDLIEFADSSKNPDPIEGAKNKTPGKYIEVYEIHGCLPETFLTEEDTDEYVQQIQIVGLYTGKNGDKQGITLFKKEEKELPFKFIARDKIYGRALGRSAVEELFEAQVWVNYGMIRKREMLDEAGKIIYKTDDSAVAARQNTNDMVSGQILEVKQGSSFDQVNNTPHNIPVFDTFVQEWEAHARQLGAATESILGESPTAGTPFKLQELITAESHSLHEYRKGKVAAFLDEVHQDWIVPELVKDILKGKEFLAELDLDELQNITEAIVDNSTNRMVIEKILNGELVLREEIDAYREQAKTDFQKKGNKRFISILEGEFKDVPISIKINIAGKQKDIAGNVDKLVNIVRFIMPTYDPQTQSFAAFNDPTMVKMFNEIFEKSGISPISYSTKRPPQMMQPQQMQQMGAMPMIDMNKQKSPLPMGA